MDSKNRKREKRTSVNSLKPRRALIVTPSSIKAMDVSGGVAKVSYSKMYSYMIEYLNSSIHLYKNHDFVLKSISDL